MLSQLLVDLQDVLAGASVLNTTTILGYPNTARSEPTLPIVSVVFNAASYGRQPVTGAPRQRLGQTQPAGVAVDVMVYVFASNEYQLLGYCDLLVTMRRQVSAIVSDTIPYQATYGEIRRSEFAGATVEERFLAYVAEMQITLSNPNL